MTSSIRFLFLFVVGSELLNDCAGSSAVASAVSGSASSVCYWWCQIPESSLVVPIVVSPALVQTGVAGMVPFVGLSELVVWCSYSILVMLVLRSHDLIVLSYCLKMASQYIC